MSSGAGKPSIGSSCIAVTEHSKHLCNKLQELRSSHNLVDLDIICEDATIQVHKVIMAASCKFFKEELTKPNASRSIKLEDFGMQLKREAIQHLVEFVYSGEVAIPINVLSPVCEAAHVLGVYGLVEYLPAPAKRHIPPAVQESGTQSEDPSGTSIVNVTSSVGQQLQTGGGQMQWQHDHFVPQHQQPVAVQQYPQEIHQPSFYSSGNQMYKHVYNNSYESSHFTLGAEPSQQHHEAIIIDLDSNSLDGGQIEEQPQEQPRNPQPKGRLRIINQPDGPMTENIHDLKSQSSSHANLQPSGNCMEIMAWMPPNNTSSLMPFDQAANAAAAASFDVDANSTTWFSQFGYNDEGPSWTTPASSSASWTAEPTQTWPSVPQANPTPTTEGAHPAGNSLVTSSASQNAKADDEEEGEANDKVKIRPPPPLIAKGSRIAGKRLELEVRKDLTLPSAPTAREDNVFQADDDVVVDRNVKCSSDQGATSTASSSSSSTTAPTAVNFQCLECSMMLSTDAQLRSHMRHAHKDSNPADDDTLLFCPVCKTAVLRGLENLKLHLYKSHGIGEVFRCEECNFETPNKVNYTKHLDTHTETPKKLRMCSKCGKAFKSRAGLKFHQQKHSEEDLFNCTVCDFKTPQKINLVKHMAAKHNKNEQGEELKLNIACQLCPFKCGAEHILKAHMLRKHTSRDNMKHKCSQCDYATVERAALNKHIRFKHTNERPFTCSTCGFCTHTNSAMARHKRGHNQSKPHTCDICGVAYADKKRLRDHLVVHESESKPLPSADCDFCGFSTRRRDNLQAHIKKMHPELVKNKMHKAEPNEEAVGGQSHIMGHVNEDGSIRPMLSDNPSSMQ